MAREYALTDEQAIGSGIPNLYCDDGSVTFSTDADSRNVGLSVTAQTADGFESTDGTIGISQDGSVIDLIQQNPAVTGWAPTITGTDLTASAVVASFYNLGQTDDGNVIGYLSVSFTITNSDTSPHTANIPLPAGVTTGVTASFAAAVGGVTVVATSSATTTAIGMQIPASVTGGSSHCAGIVVWSD